MTSPHNSCLITHNLNILILLVTKNKEMPVIELETHIKADRQIVFDLARSIDFQSKVVTSSNEKAVAGRTSRLIVLNETVTYRGNILG